MKGTSLLGGVRTPQVDAPIATLAGIGNNAANGAAISQFCRLFGLTVPFTAQQLAGLYKNHGKFVSAWSKDIDQLVSAGFLRPADGVELQNAAGSSKIGK